MCPYWYRNFSPQAQDKLRNLPALEKLGLQFAFKIEAACILTHLIMAICSLLFWIAGVQAGLLFRTLRSLPQVKTEGAIKRDMGWGECVSWCFLSVSEWLPLWNRRRNGKWSCVKIKGRKRKQGWNLSWLRRNKSFKIMTLRTFLAVRWLRLPLPLGGGEHRGGGGWGGAGSIPGGGPTTSRGVCSGK